MKYKSDSSVNILSNKGVLIKIINEKKLDYYMVPINGNFGYNGTMKMINRVKNNDGCYYIMENSIVIEENEDYNVYYYGRTI